MTEPIYFGCLGSIGHYFYLLKEHRTTEIPKGLPWGYDVDGKLQPEEDNKQGHAKLHHVNGWTALAWWDMTVDSRPRSASVLIIQQSGRTFEEMIALLLKHYPEVATRQTVELYE